MTSDCSSETKLITDSSVILKDFKEVNRKRVLFNFVNHKRLLFIAPFVLAFRAFYILQF